MKPRIHELKTLSRYFDRVREGVKNFEVRRNDRDFNVGDYLCLKEQGKYSITTREQWARVTYILHGGDFGIDPCYCVMSIELCDKPGDGDA